MGRKGRNPETLRALITDSAETIIVEQGLSGCTARAITTKAGCALGSLSYLFGGIEHVILAVNTRTLAVMGNLMFEQALKVTTERSADRLEALALAYFHYARNNLNRWHALFALRLSSHEELPEEYLTLRNGLIERITTFFAHDVETRGHSPQILARTMYEAVHGVVILGLDQRLGGSPEDVEERIRLLVKKLSAG
ncbi:TetR/AcrR family transcriptional regulator [Acetobacter thailandicus]|uniref:TetR/AcrR family transcriptional regulator n=1 Tax=Acetobacter thailandicus TaxID=1502842 RepID=A0ABT3QGM7_9PROT|nr:TetR/AcrR family transcriptional regulator [Acetobacter thailandicus]MCX2564439.1 TetR/AcrR family transcriptional regulator [Acetobacter thailandicus]NHN95419.1 TetR/AcrR family transcriptional regulator [Acetobacter thailandicus]